MIKKINLIIFIWVLVLSKSNAQINPSDTSRPTLPGCGYVEDPAIRQYTNEIISRMYSRSKDKTTQREALAVYKIPVVVHVIEPATGSSIITDAQVNAFIANLNTAYRGTGYYSNSPDIEIEFELAKWDPSCAPTAGITRYDASGNAQYVSKGVFNTGVSWDVVQSWRAWNKSTYMNIWIVHKLDNGAAGVGGASNGLITLASEVTRAHDYVTPHEVGHYLGVAHPFPEFSGSCGCGDGDGLADTPNLMSYGIGAPCTHESGCSPVAKSSINPCTNSPFGQIQENIMNYVNTGCDLRFTNDQKNLMRGMLETYHASLLTSPVLGASAPSPTASITGETTFCLAGSNWPNLAAVCVCSSVSGITLNGSPIPESSLRSKPILPAGQSRTWNFNVSCSNGTTASKSVKYYNPGVTNVKASCVSANTYSVTFDNPDSYIVTSSAGTVSGNSVINIPNASNLTLTVTDANGCGNDVVVEVPCCAQNLVAAAQCTPTAINGLSQYFGIDNFTFGTINKSSSSSYSDGSNYIDRACSELATVSAAESYPISVKGYFSNQHYVKVYIDYNNDGLFTGTNPNELVLSGVTSGSGGNTLASNIVIPESAVRNTRLRIRVLADWVSSSNSCTVDGAVGFGSGQIEDYSIKINAPLPVHLLSFTGKAEKNANHLKWSTTWESQNAGFEIQRSEDAVNFENTGFVDGKQNVSGNSDYQHIDQKVNQGSTYYYRLKQIDNDGHFELSKIITVKSWYESMNPFIFPNPVTAEQFTLSLPDVSSYSIRMFSVDGKEQAVTVVDTTENELTIKGKQKLPAGLYLLKMTSKSNSAEKVVKVVVQ